MKIDIRGPACLGLLAWFAACGSPDPASSPTAAGPEPPPQLSPPSAPLSTVANRNWGWIAPDPANPRYLRAGGASGQPFSITSYGSLVGCGDPREQARRLKQHGANYAVVWYRWSGCEGDAPSWLAAPWTGPWRLVCDPRDPGQRERCPERPMYDLTQFDEEYWRRLDALIAAADDASDGTNKRLVVRVHLFARQEFGIGRETNPFRGGNNVNGVRTHEDPARDPDLRAFTWAAADCALVPCDEPARSLFQQQQAYVRKLLDVTHAHGNVVYQMLNEPPGSEDPTSDAARAFTFFAEYWSWFVKDYLASRYGVARLVLQDVQTNAFAIPNVDIADARWGNHGPNLPESAFLEDALPSLTGAIRAAYMAHSKAIDLDEFANAFEDPDQLRREAWAIALSGGQFHIEDACDPEYRRCDYDGESFDARPWVPVRSIEAFKAASGWRFDRARPVHSDAPASVRWFFWMVQDGPPDAVGFTAAGAQDHVGYLAHHDRLACRDQPLAVELPGVPAGAAEYVARLWDPSGTDYVKDAGGRALEHRFAWSGGAFDWCATPLRDAILARDDVVVHVHARR
jgi:hypothetical protein